MWIARIRCSDPDCADESLVEVAELAQLEALVCGCDCVAEVVGLPDWVGDAGVVVALPRRGDRLDAAA